MKTADGSYAIQCLAADLTIKKVRKRILLNWYYHRADLTGYLLEMSDEFELIFIYKYERPEKPELIDWTGKNVSVIY